MLKRKQIKAIQKFIYIIFKKLSQLLVKGSRKLFFWLARLLLFNKNRRTRGYVYAKSGFVLPTVTLLLLVVALVIAAILFRTTSRTTQVMGAREEQVIYNAATPAIERAKAKLEYLFLKDTRLPSGAPSDALLMSLLLNNQNQYYPTLLTADDILNPDPYTFKDELDAGGRLDINGDTSPDTAWVYQTDVDGDGQQETIVYGIFLKRRNDRLSDNSIAGTVTIEGSNELQKALALVTRNGPLNTVDVSDSACATLTQATPPPAPGSIVPVDESAWYPVGSAILRKTFQVDAIVISNKQGTSRTVATLEFQQDRQLDRGNKWGAWFRYDLEIYPGADFNWNGAMYSAGNIFVGADKFRAYLVSDDDSCFYTKDASEIMVSQDNPSGYQGQVLIGRVGPNDSQSTYQGYFDLQKPDNSPQPNVQLTTNTDSAVNTKTRFDISLDPVALFTQDESKARGGDVTNRDARDTNWENQVFVQQGRIINKSEVPPYVDDTYRADNRYGPKPKYDKIDSNLWLNDSTKKNGKPIPSTETKLIDNTINTVTDRDFRNLGLDGYWERRAWADGMRVIVGPRLDLGNTFGWGNIADPLYPVNINPISHEQQQRRTWRDNLAAVQATAIYHKGSGNANFPIAFMATTVHPGTQQTDLNSRSFNRVLPTNGFFSNFFTGEGTNGWEYEVVPGSTESETTFATMVNDTGTALRKALDNLAYFAGDPQGAFPPVPESSGQQVHPDTELAMWGNFSNLRRTLDQMRAGTPYANLSIADKTYLHTAAGALGMLAYNLTYNVADTASATDKGNLGDALWQRINGASTVTQVLDTSTITRPTPTGTGSAARYTATALQNYRNSLSTALLNKSSDDYLRGLIKGTGAISETDIKVRLARMIHTRVQAERDRENGFFSPTIAKILTSADTPGTAPFNYAVQFTSTSRDTNYAVNDPFNPLAANNPLNAGVTPLPPLKLPCNPADFGYFGVGTGSGGAPANATEERQVIALAAALCSTQPKYPSLYYIFPAINHGHSNAVADLDGNSGNDAQPTGEPYISDTYVSTTTNGTVLYQALTQTEIATGVALRPKNDNAFTGSCDDTNWCLPTGQASSRPVDDDRFITTPSGDDKRFVSFIDTAFYDGREAMTVRALNIDLDLLRRTSIGSDILLPRSGVVYAFREDAVREDAIARPSWSNTYTNAYATNPPAAAKDPALVDNGISPKPVDYIPDPDRRPYGFRLRNGKDIRRIPEVANDPANNILRRGLTFISDNPVYIQGDFNLHSTDGTRANQIEEFIDAQKLSANWSNFYSRSDLNTKFARSNDGQDTWRPSEILSDAITILSDNFKEGYLDLGITSDTTNTTVNPYGQYSYRSMNVPTNPSSTNNNGPQKAWVLEDGTVRKTVAPLNRDLPIKISRNGHPFFCPTSATVLSTGVCTAPQEYNLAYQSFTKTAYSSVNSASSGVGGPGSIVDSILVSGVVPTRKGQGNGGFHNFPRFIENWNGVDAKISGSFVQLNFSTYGTAPYNQNAWEPPASGSLPDPSGVNLWYYQAPNRAWGYDVGLQYAPAGPLAQRFVSSGIPRSEFYRDLKVDDPYICRLRRGLNARFPNRDTAASTECNPN